MSTTFLAEKIEQTTEQLTRLLHVRTCRFETFPFDRQLPRVEPGRIVLPAAEPGLAPWTTDAGVEIPLRYRGLPLGRFVVVPTVPTSGVAFPPSARTRAIEIVSAVGAAVAEALLHSSNA